MSETANYPIRSIEPGRPEPTSTPNLNAALIKAQMEVEVVVKTGKTGNNWPYAKSEVVFGTCGTALNNNGLALLPLGWHRVEPLAEPGELDPKTRAIARGHYMRRYFELIHKSGESKVIGPFDYPAIPENGRPLDMAWRITSTLSLNYAYRDLLCLSRLTEQENKDFQAEEDRREKLKRTSAASEAAEREKREPTQATAAKPGCADHATSVTVTVTPCSELVKLPKSASVVAIEPSTADTATDPVEASAAAAKLGADMAALVEASALRTSFPCPACGAAASEVIDENGEVSILCANGHRGGALAPGESMDAAARDAAASALVERKLEEGKRAAENADREAAERTRLEKQEKERVERVRAAVAAERAAEAKAKAKAEAEAAKSSQSAAPAPTASTQLTPSTAASASAAPSAPGAPATAPKPATRSEGEAKAILEARRTETVKILVESHAEALKKGTKSEAWKEWLTGVVGLNLFGDVGIVRTRIDDKVIEKLKACDLLAKKFKPAARAA